MSKTQLSELQGSQRRPFFVLVCSSSELSNTEGISAAGADLEAQKLTPSLDAEFIELGETVSANFLPVSPEGIVSPALVSKACLNILDAEIRIVNAGCFHKFKGLDPAFHVDLELEPSKNFAQEDSFSFEECENIFLNSIELLDHLGFDEEEHELIIAECVVGGTTSALGLLELLGYESLDLISSSFKENNKVIKEKILTRFKQRTKAMDLSQLENPIYNCAVAGDKAQVVITAMCLAAMQREAKTILAGGTQMLAIYALIQKMTDGFFMDELVEVITSPWLISDSGSNATALAKKINKDLKLKSLKDFSSIEAVLQDEIKKIGKDKYPSWDEIKKLYDQGHVKEGVGMGALLKLLSATL